MNLVKISMALSSFVLHFVVPIKYAFFCGVVVFVLCNSYEIRSVFPHTIATSGLTTPKDVFLHFGFLVCCGDFFCGIVIIIYNGYIVYCTMAIVKFAARCEYYHSKYNEIEIHSLSVYFL